MADHMIGNVYVQFREEEHAANALKNLIGRFYAGRPIIVDFSLVTDFREATCRQYEENSCNRGGYCNFMHLKRISRELRRYLFRRYRRRITPMKVIAGGTGRQVLTTREDGAGAQVEGGTGVQLRKVVKRRVEPLLLIIKLLRLVRLCFRRISQVDFQLI